MRTLRYSNLGDVEAVAESADILIGPYQAAMLRNTT